MGPSVAGDESLFRSRSNPACGDHRHDDRLRAVGQPERSGAGPSGAGGGRKNLDKGVSRDVGRLVKLSCRFIGKHLTIKVFSALFTSSQLDESISIFSSVTGDFYLILEK